MKSRTTLKKISANLNLSVSTVSRALKDHPDISEETKLKVKELASLLEYEPNTYAINLRTNSSRIFGLVVPAIANTFYDSFISAAEQEARENGFSLMILQSGDDPVLEAENLRLCRANRVAGVMISVAPGSQGEAFKKLEEAAIPVIFFDKVPDSDTYNKVCLADAEAATIAASVIIKYRKKKVLGVFGNPELSITQKRLAAFTRQFEKESPETKLVIRHCFNSNEAQNVASEFCSSNSVDNIFAMSDEILVGVMKALYKLNVSIPSDISVLAISNGFLPGIYKPLITYVETSGFELGKLVMKRMMDYLGGQTFSRSLILPTRLVEGKSL
ncbi:MAG: LacI family DNA-binding transcriptional regulator [Chitinophagaceae bacterium]